MTVCEKAFRWTFFLALLLTYKSLEVWFIKSNLKITLFLFWKDLTKETEVRSDALPAQNECAKLAFCISYSDISTIFA